MPVRCEERDGTFRLVEAETGEIATTTRGEPRDGGGHQSQQECAQQASAINSSRDRNSPSSNPRSGGRLRNPSRQ